MAAGLRFLSPDPYSVFQLNERIPAASQRLRFAVTAPATARTVEFRLNDELIGIVERCALGAVVDLWRRASIKLAAAHETGGRSDRREPVVDIFGR